MSVSLTGPSPLFSPAKQAGDASEYRDHSCGRLTKLPQFSIPPWTPLLCPVTLALLPSRGGAYSLPDPSGLASGPGMTNRMQSCDFCPGSEMGPQEAWLSSIHSLETLPSAMWTGPVSTLRGQETA